MTTTAESAQSAGQFPETADVETSSDDYAGRFAGPVGEWMLAVQKDIVLRWLKAAPGATILDVGGGHGQLAIPLCAAGHPVTVVGSAESCRKRIAGIVESGQCRFQVGNVIELPYSGRSFDTAISFRLVTHCERWPKLIEELCRVARHSVIVDYPTSQSVNRIAPRLFEAKKKMEGNTRTWTLFRHEQIVAEFAKCGFRPGRRAPQFFLPMVLHRMLRCRPLSIGMEAICRMLGLTRLGGSPVIVEMVKAD